jgi:hypothetical protein
MISHIRYYAKAYALVVATVLVAIQTVLNKGLGWQLQDFFVVGAAGLGAFAVSVVPNLPGSIGNYAKQVVGVLTAAAVAAQVASADGVITGSEWITIVLMGAGAVGVVAIGNSEPPSIPPPDLGPLRTPGGPAWGPSET